MNVPHDCVTNVWNELQEYVERKPERGCRPRRIEALQFNPDCYMLPRMVRQENTASRGVCYSVPTLLGKAYVQKGSYIIPSTDGLYHTMSDGLFKRHWKRPEPYPFYLPHGSLVMLYQQDPDGVVRVFHGGEKEVNVAFERVQKTGTIPSDDPSCLSKVCRAWLVRVVDGHEQGGGYRGTCRRNTNGVQGG